MLELLFRVTDADFQLGNQRPLLCEDHMQLADQLALADDQVHLIGVGERPAYLAAQRHASTAYVAAYSPR